VTLGGPTARTVVGCLSAVLLCAGPIRGDDAAPPGFQRFMARGRIPSVDDPQFVSAAAAKIPPEAWVLGVTLDGVARAYSLNLLNAHEVVNDRIGTKPVSVVWCPLANAGVVYNRRVKERELHFEPSGVLMNGSIVVQDKETDTFWPIILGKGAVGPLKGTVLESLATVVKTEWKDWRRDHPETLVWSFAGDEHIERSPYQSYIDSPFGHKGIAATDARLRTKDPVYAFEHAGRHYAVPFPACVGGRAFVVGGRSIFLYRPADVSVYYSTRAYASAVGFAQKAGVWVDQATGARFDPDKAAFIGPNLPKALTGFDTFWYMWSLTYPDTEVVAAR
jgi:Protein of unknown function (DUF3179)